MYTNLPPDSRKVPAPIDPSGKASNKELVVLVTDPTFTVSKWFYISSAQV